MPERSNYNRDRVTLTLQPRGARPRRTANTRFPVNIDTNTFPNASSMQKMSSPRRARALPAVPPARAYTYPMSSTQNARRIVRPLPYCPLNPRFSSSPTSSSDATLLRSPPSLSPLLLPPFSSPSFPSSFSSPLSSSSASPPSSSSLSSPVSASSSSLSSSSTSSPSSFSPPSSSSTLPTLSIPLSPTFSTPLSPIQFASRNAWAGIDNSPIEFRKPKICRSDCTSDSEEYDEDAVEPYQRNYESIHYRWKTIWRKPSTQDPPKKWVTETGKGQRRTVKDYANVLDLLRAL